MAFTKSDIVLNKGGANEAFIRQISSLTHATNHEIGEGVVTGSVSPGDFFINKGEPMSQVTTTDTALLAMNSSLFLSRGFCADDGVADAANASVIPFKERANCALFKTGNDHAALTARHTLVIPTSVSGTRAEAVELQVDLKFLAQNPTVNPVVTLGSQALPGSQFRQCSQFYGAYIGGSEILESVGFTYNPGITVVMDLVQGGNYPTLGFITEVKPTLEIQTENLEASLAAINGAGLGAGITVYLATKQSGGTIQPITENVHAAITALNGIQQTSQISASQGQNGQGTITINLGSPTGGDAVTVGTGIPLPAK